MPPKARRPRAVKLPFVEDELLTHCPVCLKLLKQGQPCVCCTSPVVVTDNGFTANVIEGDDY